VSCRNVEFGALGGRFQMREGQIRSLSEIDGPPFRFPQRRFRGACLFDSILR